MNNFKKSIALLLISAFVLSTSALCAFTDEENIGLSNQYAVERLSGYNIINGLPDGSFGGEKNVTRAEMAKMISVMLNKGEPSNNSSSFSDVTGTWSEKYVANCVANGIIAGKSATSFAPNDNVTGAEAAKMLLISLDIDANKAGLVGSEWYDNSINLANRFGLTYDLDADLSKPLNREDSALMISNALSAKKAVYEDEFYIQTGQYLYKDLGYTDDKTDSARYIFDKLLQSNNVPQRFSGFTYQIENNYDISLDDLESAHLAITPMSPGIDEIFIANVKPEKMDTVKTALETRQKYLKDEKAFYPSDMDAVELSQIYINGDYIMLYVSGNPDSYAPVKTLFETLTK